MVNSRRKVCLYIVLVGIWSLPLDLLGYNKLKECLDFNS